MTASLDSATDVVETLISSCRHTHEGFRSAAEAVTDEDLKRLFSIYAQQRTRFAEELRQHLPAEVAGDDSRAISGTAWDEMGVHEVIRECLNAEKDALDLYSQALAKKAMPTKAHFLVSAQFSLLQKVHERVRGMFPGTSTLMEERA